MPLPRVQTSGSSAVRTPQDAASQPTSVTVKSGDSMSKIASRMGVNLSALVQANAGRYPSLVSNPNAIQPGWTISAPGHSGTTPSSAPAPATPAAAQGWGATGSTHIGQRAGGNAASGTAGAAGTHALTGKEAFGQALAAGGAQSIDMRMKRHADAIDKTGVGVYYGDHSSFKSMSPDERAKYVSENAKAGGAAPSTNIKENSCIGWAMENVGAAYAAAGKSDRWAEIQRTVVSKGSKGTDLAKELQKDGWEATYWNPDAKHPDDSNAEHTFSAVQVARGNGYYGLKIDHTVENYRPTAGQGTTQDLSGIDQLNKVPFFFGLAKGGVHTFVGHQGKVNEFHWSEMPDSKHAIQDTPLKDWGWNSGVIMTPPGTWPKS